MTYITNDYKVESSILHAEDVDIDLTSYPYIASKINYMEGCYLAVFISDEEVKGLALITEDGRELRINHFEISEQERGNHYGVQFANELIAEYKDEEFDKITLQAREPSLVIFWQKFGFKKTEDREMELTLHASSEGLRAMGLEY